MGRMESLIWLAVNVAKVNFAKEHNSSLTFFSSCEKMTQASPFIWPNKMHFWGAQDDNFEGNDDEVMRRQALNTTFGRQ